MDFFPHHLFSEMFFYGAVLLVRSLNPVQFHYFSYSRLYENKTQTFDCGLTVFKECVKTLRPFYLTHVVFGVVSCPPSLGHKLTTATRPRSDPDLDTMFVLSHVGHIRPTSTLYMGQEEVGPYKMKCMWATSACVRGGDV